MADDELRQAVRDMDPVQIINHLTRTKKTHEVMDYLNTNHSIQGLIRYVYQLGSAAHGWIRGSNLDELVANLTAKLNQNSHPSSWAGPPNALTVVGVRHSGTNWYFEAESIHNMYVIQAVPRLEFEGSLHELADSIVDNDHPPIFKPITLERVIMIDVIKRAVYASKDWINHHQTILEKSQQEKEKQKEEGRKAKLKNELTILKELIKADVDAAAKWIELPGKEPEIKPIGLKRIEKARKGEVINCKWCKSGDHDQCRKLQDHVFVCECPCRKND